MLLREFILCSVRFAIAGDIAGVTDVRRCWSNSSYCIHWSLCELRGRMAKSVCFQHSVSVFESLPLTEMLRWGKLLSHTTHTAEITLCSSYLLALSPCKPGLSVRVTVMLAGAACGAAGIGEVVWKTRLCQHRPRTAQRDLWGTNPSGAGREARSRASYPRPWRIRGGVRLLSSQYSPSTHPLPVFCHDWGGGSPALAGRLREVPVTTEVAVALPSLFGRLCEVPVTTEPGSPTRALQARIPVTERAPLSRGSPASLCHSARVEAGTEGGHSGSLRARGAGKRPPHLQASPTAERKRSTGHTRPASPSASSSSTPQPRAGDRAAQDRASAPWGVAPLCSAPSSGSANQRRPHAAAVSGAPGGPAPVSYIRAAAAGARPERAGGSSRAGRGRGGQLEPWRAVWVRTDRKPSSAAPFPFFSRGERGEACRAVPTSPSAGRPLRRQRPRVRASPLSSAARSRSGVREFPLWRGGPAPSEGVWGGRGAGAFFFLPSVFPFFFLNFFFPLERVKRALCLGGVYGDSTGAVGERARGWGGGTPPLRRRRRKKKRGSICRSLPRPWRTRTQRLWRKFWRISGSTKAPGSAWSKWRSWRRNGAPTVGEAAPRRDASLGSFTSSPPPSRFSPALPSFPGPRFEAWRVCASRAGISCRTRNRSAAEKMADCNSTSWVSFRARSGAGSSAAPSAGNLPCWDGELAAHRSSFPYPSVFPAFRCLFGPIFVHSFESWHKITLMRYFGFFFF